MHFPQYAIAILILILTIGPVLKKTAEFVIRWLIGMTTLRRTIKMMFWKGNTGLERCIAGWRYFILVFFLATSFLGATVLASIVMLPLGIGLSHIPGLAPLGRFYWLATIAINIYGLKIAVLVGLLRILVPLFPTPVVRLQRELQGRVELQDRFEFESFREAYLSIWGLARRSSAPRALAFVTAVIAHLTLVGAGGALLVAGLSRYISLNLHPGFRSSKK